MEKDFMEQINDLRAKKAELVKNAKQLIADGKFDEANAANGEIETINNKMETIQKLADESEERAQGKNTENEVKPFQSLGEQLQAIRNARVSGIMDERLAKINDAVAGASEGTGADGGFAVQQDFAGAILETAVRTGEILSRVDSYTVGAGSNGAKWLQIDEEDTSETVYGGVRMYWEAEGYGTAGSKPKFKMMQLTLEKMMGLAYATQELLEDAPFMTGFFGRAFTEAATRLTEDAIISGNGAGKPLGILKSGALIAVPKETSQAAGTINGENVLKMWTRADVRRRNNAVWLVHPDLEEQLPKMTISEGNDKKLIWMPEGGLSGSQYSTLLGRPVVPDDNCSEVGKKGDIMLADLNQYMFLKKGNVRQDWSMHVEFLTDQMAFRVIFRCNGAPKTNKPVKLKNSKNTRSPFVTLEDRV